MPVSVRSFWKGYLRLALVAIPVRLVTAEKSESTPKFHQIDRVSGQRIHYQKVVPGRGEVPKDDIVMGYEIEPSQFVLLGDEELEAVRLELAPHDRAFAIRRPARDRSALFLAPVLPAA